MSATCLASENMPEQCPSNEEITRQNAAGEQIQPVSKSTFGSNT